MGIESYAVGLKICAITAGIKNYKSMIEKKREKTNTVSKNQVKHHRNLSSFSFK